jgi:thiol-disulfide isomerase/thioredoxin
MTLLLAERDALTVSWTATPDAVRYVLQVRTTTADDDDTAFTTLASSLQNTQVRKKNLDHAAGYFFRVGAVLQEDETALPTTWTTHPDAFVLLTAEQDTNRMAAPTVTPGGTSHAALVGWKDTATTSSGGYDLQMRENVGGAAWGTIVAAFAPSQVKKKNLVSATGYQFRVRVAASDDTSTPAAFSPPSLPFVAWGLSAAIQRLFGSLAKDTLLKQAAPIPLDAALGGKEFILLYASAHWCGPCRQFTPQLVQWYHSLGGGKTVEVIFLSADHDANGFRDYYRGMPWLAIDFDEDTREELMSKIKVTGIPRLCVLDGRTGQILEDNAVGKPLDVTRWRRLASSASK